MGNFCPRKRIDETTQDIKKDIYKETQQENYESPNLTQTQNQNHDKINGKKTNITTRKYI